MLQKTPKRLRESARRVRRRMKEVGSHSLSSIAVRMLAAGVRHRVLLLSIYRYKNGRLLAQILEEVKAQKWRAKLWALDEVHPSLRAYSVGAGTGLKFPLLNGLIDGESLSEFDWVVVADDDILLERGSMADFLAIASRAGMAIAQPSHSSSSFSNYAITQCHASAIARLTTFVEIGPMFAIGSGWFDRLLPFPEGTGMGWGLDIAWSDLTAKGARLGIIDWVTVRHLHPMGKNYDNTPEQRRYDEALRARGLDSYHEIQKTLAVWRPWQLRVPWHQPAVG